MLISLGFLLASLVFIGLSTAYRKRIVRLTTDKIRSSVPITEAEIRADKDRLRAQFAIRVHKLEAQGEQQRLAAARQRIEMNRRDARIAELEAELDAVSASLEEHINARRVLEHTVTDRLPWLEQQLDDARGLIQNRDQEMVALKSETTRSVRALDEAMQMNAQQRGELERMKSVVGRRSTPDRDTAASKPAAGSAKAGARSGKLSAADIDAAASAAAAAQRAPLEARIEEQAAELNRLRAALAAYEKEAPADSDGDDKKGRGPDAARINALQAQLAVQNETIQKLRSELATGNDRLARQAAQFMEEMRRLGSSSGAMSPEQKRLERFVTRAGQQERTGQAAPAKGTNGAADQSTAERQSQPLARRLIPGNAKGPTSTKVAEYIRALSDGDQPSAPDGGIEAETTSTATTSTMAPTEPYKPATTNRADAKPVPAPKSRLKLLDRISGIGKS
ncbi:MAG: hypothetical protein AB7O43_02395 [Hyphomicrobiaceae bacterium]